MDSADRWRYGIVALSMGLSVIVFCFTVAVWQYETPTDGSAVLSRVTGTVAGIVGAYSAFRLVALRRKRRSKTRKMHEPLWRGRRISGRHWLVPYLGTVRSRSYDNLTSRDLPATSFLSTDAR